MKKLYLLVFLLSFPLFAEEKRQVRLRQVDVRQRLGLAVNPVGIGRLRMRVSVEHRYMMKKENRVKMTN